MRTTRYSSVPREELRGRDIPLSRLTHLDVALSVGELSIADDEDLGWKLGDWIDAGQLPD